MSDSNLHDRVQAILSEADTSSSSLATGDGDDESAETALLETASEASDLLESADPDEFLAAVGLDTLADGTEPESIPEAIARGEEENVVALQRLLHLANLADRADDSELEGAIGDLRETMGERVESATADARTDTAETSAVESTADEDESTGDFGDRLLSSMQSSFEEFGDDIAQLKERLETASADTVRNESTSEADETDDAVTNAEPSEDDDDGGLLETGFGGDGGRGTALGGPSRHSTMAPPPSQRADMRGLVRHSTMPNKHE